MPRKLLSQLACGILLVWFGSPTVARAAVAQDPEDAPPTLASKLADHFTQAWYYTEVVVFQRPEVMDYMADEVLTRRPLPLRRDMRTFADDSVEALMLARLDPAERAFLTFPYLDLGRLEAGSDEGQTGSPGAGFPAIDPALAPDPVLGFLNDVADFEASLAAQSYRWLDADTYTLTREADRLARSGRAEILLHGRWLQPVPPRETPEPLLVRAGPDYGDLSGLEGTIDITLGRYLHIGVDLRYVAPLLGQTPLDRALPPPGFASATPQRLTPADFTTAGFMNLRQSRRTRSGETLYIDHPKLGVLVKIEPVAVPDDLSATYAALKESSQ